MARTATPRRDASDTPPLIDRLHAWWAGRGPVARGFVSQPEPKTIGRFARGRQLVAGNYLFAGHLIEAPDSSIWDITPPDRVFSQELHGFTWLDDLAAVGDMRARQKAQQWLFDWIERFGDGQGPGWAPDLVGRRLIRWTHHALFILRARDKAQSAAFYEALSRQLIFLSRRWKTTHHGLPRFEALAGLIYGSLSLEGMAERAGPALKAMTAECRRQIGPDGGLMTRNPEDLLEVVTLLIWTIQAQEEAGQTPDRELQVAVQAMAPTLRALRHADGGLARFHGGGRGIDGRLDLALAASGVKDRPDAMTRAMGYARLSGGRTSVIADAAAPPSGRASRAAHASTLAFELTSGRRPMVVNCGAGGIFGADWLDAGRATPSHSTLGIEGLSSSRLERGPNARPYFVETPQEVRAVLSELGDGTRLEMSHDGYGPTHGLTHARTLDLTFDGRGIAGEDLLMTLDDADRQAFDRAMDRVSLQGIGYAIRFHLHPDVDASVDLGGQAISIALRSGEVWVFRHDGVADLALAPSVYLEKGRLKPRAAQQVVLSGKAMSYATRVRWSFAKAQETPDNIRDLAQEDEAAPSAV